MMKSTKILAELDEIRKILDPVVVEKARKYDEISKYLKDVKLRVSKVSASVDERGISQVVVAYEPFSESVKVFGKNSVESSPRFKAINFLDLIEMADMKRISTAIEQEKSKLDA